MAKGARLGSRQRGLGRQAHRPQRGTAVAVQLLEIGEPGIGGRPGLQVQEPVDRAGGGAVAAGLDQAVDQGRVSGGEIGLEPVRPAGRAPGRPGSRVRRGRSSPCRSAPGRSSGRGRGQRRKPLRRASGRRVGGLASALVEGIAETCERSRRRSGSSEIAVRNAAIERPVGPLVAPAGSSATATPGGPVFGVAELTPPSSAKSAAKTMTGVAREINRGLLGMRIWASGSWFVGQVGRRREPPPGGSGGGSACVRLRVVPQPPGGTGGWPGSILLEGSESKPESGSPT